MHLAIIHKYPDVPRIRTCERAVCHLLHDTFQDSRHETSINSTTDNAVVEFKCATPFQIVRLLSLHIQCHILTVNLEFVSKWNTFHNWADKHTYLTELACTTRLFLVTIHLMSFLGNSLPIRNLRSKEFDFNTEFMLQSPFDHVDMLLSLTTENGLFQFLGIFYNNCRILGGHLVQRISKLSLIILILSLNGCTILRSREYDMLISNICPWLRKSNVVLASTKLDSTTDIPSHKFRNLIFSTTSNSINDRDPLVILCLRIPKILTF